MTGPRTNSLEEYLRARYRLDPETSCWLWLRSTAGEGYGYFLWKGVWTYAHRASYSTWKGEIPEGAQVLHRCDTPLCLNPDHLFLGSQKENLEDMTRKGRRRTHTPEARAKRKASHKRAWAEGRLTLKERDPVTGQWKGRSDAV